MINTQVLKRKFEFGPVIAIAIAVIFISFMGQMATDSQGEWFRSLEKPSWNPPNWVFAPVWTTIYVLLIIAATIIWHKTQGIERRKLMTLFTVNGIFNLAWSYAFFQAQSATLGFIDILFVWITILLLVLRTWPISKVAAMMLLPYLLWVTFASVLNASIMLLN